MKKLILVSMVFILAACSAGGSELERNWQTWESAGISHYRFELSLSCFCGFMDQMPLSVEVLNGEVASLNASDGNPITADDPNYQHFTDFGTIDLLFAEIENAMRSAGAGEIRVTYDPMYGFPVEASIDYIELAIDDELYITVSGFEQLP